MSSPQPQHDVQLRSRLPRLAEEAVERARLRVVPRRRTSAPRVPFVTLVSLLLLTGVVGLLLFNTNMQQASFAATELEQQAQNLTARQQTLQVELEALRDPQRVAEQARRQGLVPPPPPAFLDLETGKISGKPMAATAESDLNIAPPAPVVPSELDPDPVIIRVPRDPVQTGNQGNGGNGRNENQGRGGNRDQQRGNQDDGAEGNGAQGNRQNGDRAARANNAQNSSQARGGR